MTLRKCTRRPLACAVGMVLMGGVAPGVMAQQYSVGDGAVHDVSGQTFATTVGHPAGIAMDVFNPGTTVTGSNVTATTAGNGVASASATLGGRIALTNSTLSTTGSSSTAQLRRMRAAPSSSRARPSPRPAPTATAWWRPLLAPSQ